MRQNKRDEYRRYYPGCECCRRDEIQEPPSYDSSLEDITQQDKVKCIDGDNVYYIPRQLFARVVMGLEVPERKYVRYKTGAAMYDMSQRQFYKLVTDAKAKHKINRLVLVDLKKVDKYISYFQEE